MGVDHVEVALVHRHVRRLAHCPARVVKPRGRLRQLDEIAEVLDRAIAAAAVEIHHEGRAVGGREDDVVAADLDGVLRVACVLGKDGGRGLQHFAQHVGRELHAPDVLGGFSNLGPALAVKPHRFGVVAQLDADLSQDAVGGLFDPDQAFLGQDVIGRDTADDVGAVDACLDPDAGVPHLLPSAALPFGFRGVAVRHASALR